MRVVAALAAVILCGGQPLGKVDQFQVSRAEVLYLKSRKLPWSTPPFADVNVESKRCLSDSSAKFVTDD